MLDTHDATRKSLIITALSIFRVGIFTTLKMAKQLSLSYLQVTLRVSFDICYNLPFSTPMKMRGPWR